MGLLDLAVSVALGSRSAPERLDVGLWNGGKELTDAGYRRAGVDKGRWKIRNGQCSAEARFGPFAGTVTFDRALLLRGNDVIEETKLSSPQTLAAGTVYDHEFVAVWEQV